MILPRGWVEDFRCMAGGPTGEGYGFRQANKLCQASVSWEPSEDADCPADQPISACELSPEQQLYTVHLNCAQDTTVAIPQWDLEPTRIQFAPGGISAHVRGSLAAGSADRYVLRASTGQEMTLNPSVTSAVGSEEMRSILTVWGADGTLLGSGYASDWATYVLPSTQDYYIDLMSVIQAPLDYTVEVVIPSDGPPPEPEPTRIQFAPGAISAQVGGRLAAGEVDRYVLRASGGQEMTVNLSDAQPGVNSILIIWGEDGTVLISDHADATTWVGELPSTQDYYIDVRSVAQVSIDYVLEVVIP
jgi:hypothetical protein